MIVFEFLMVIALFGVSLVVGGSWLNEKLKKKPVVVEPKKRYVPPKSEEGGPAMHFRISTNDPMWVDFGCPREMGAQVTVNMASGRVGIYELRNEEPMGKDDGPKLRWYDFEFVRYKDPAAGSQDNPVSAVTR